MQIRDWNGRTGDSWATHWRRTDRSFGGLTERLLSRSREFRFRRAVDIGCGAGELSLALARGRPEARVTGVDISSALVEVARNRGNHPNASFVEADAAVWQPDGVAPDLVVSRHGVMFFDDPTAAFAHIAGFCADGAGLMFSCFRHLHENPIFTEVAEELPPPDEPAPDPRAPGPFAFADRDYVRDILEGGGWGGIEFEAFDFAMVAGAGEDPVGEAVTYWSSIGPAALRLAEMDDVSRRESELRLAGLAQRHLRDGIVALRAACWIVTAAKA